MYFISFKIIVNQQIHILLPRRNKIEYYALQLYELTKLLVLSFQYKNRPFDPKPKDLKQNPQCDRISQIATD